MNSDDAGRIIELCHGIGIHVAAATYVGDNQFVVLYTDPLLRVPTTHTDKLNNRFRDDKLPYSVGTEMPREGFEVLCFTKAREKVAKHG